MNERILHLALLLVAALSFGITIGMAMAQRQSDFALQLDSYVVDESGADIGVMYKLPAGGCLLITSVRVGEVACP